MIAREKAKDIKHGDSVILVTLPTSLMTLQISIRSSPTLPFVLVPAYLLFWCCLEHPAAEAISKQEPSPAVLYRHGQTQTLPRSNIIELLQRCQITNLV